MCWIAYHEDQKSYMAIRVLLVVAMASVGSGTSTGSVLYRAVVPAENGGSTLAQRPETLGQRQAGVFNLLVCQTGPADSVSGGCLSTWKTPGHGTSPGLSSTEQFRICDVPIVTRAALIPPTLHVATKAIVPISIYVTKNLFVCIG